MEKILTAELVLEMPFSYQLFLTSNGYVLSVPYGSSAIAEMNIGISDEDAQSGISDQERLELLANGIRQNPQAFTEFQVKLER
jgi:hypothetical protein